MCGVLAYYNIANRPVDRCRDEVVRLRDLMRHRGPDASGYLEGRQQSWILAHRRLSIIDLSDNGLQPMSDPSGKLHLCYNGEIYNYKHLRNELIDLGYSFRSSSDTEVILYLYQHYGTDCFRMLEGMFALIIVDEIKQNAVIARDPVGKKPLHYALLGENVVVASDPGVISQDKSYRKGLNLEGLYSILTMGGVKSPDCLFKDIYKLEPGCYRVLDKTFDINQPAQRFFDFKLSKKERHIDSADAIDTLDALLDKAVEKRMISDVPFGVFLSGGIDSALILHYMSKHTPRVNTFSIDLVSSDESKRETSVASELARQYNTNHHSVQLPDSEYIEILDQVVLKNDTLAIPDSVLLAKLSELARANGVIVIETGEGADELFLGYEKYLHGLNEGYAKLQRTRALQPVFPLLARVARAFGPDAKKDRISYLVDALDIRSNRGILSDSLYEPFFSYQSERILRERYDAHVDNNKYRLLNSSITSRVKHVDDYNPSTLSVLWNVSFRWSDFLLNRIDNFTMTSSVEARAPFLDIDVINYGLSLSDKLKVRNGSTKYILRQITEKKISKTHAELPKRGFGGGNTNMINDNVCNYLRDKLVSSYSYQHGPLMDVDHICSPSQLFTLASFHVWVDNWM